MWVRIPAMAKDGGRKILAAPSVWRTWNKCTVSESWEKSPMSFLIPNTEHQVSNTCSVGAFNFGRRHMDRICILRILRSSKKLVHLEKHFYPNQPSLTN